MNIGDARRIAKEIMELLEECSEVDSDAVAFSCEIQHSVVEVLLRYGKTAKVEDSRAWIHVRLVYRNANGELVDYVTKCSTMEDAQRYAQDRMMLSSGNFTAHYFKNVKNTDDIPF